MFYIGLYRENMKKKFLSGTRRPRLLIFGIKHHQVDLQVCSNYRPQAKNGHPWSHMFYIGLYRENVKNFLG